MLHAVIMAGGSGTRFWPASRNQNPKQLLTLSGERSMIQSTVDRLGELVPPSRVWIITNQRLVEAIREQLPELPADAIVGEPAKRDTAPCIGLAGMLISRDDPDATMVVMPADHVISPDERFQAALRLAAETVEAAPQRIVTFGIKPTYPAESFGYIERGDLLSENATTNIYAVNRFTEKPQAEVAREYLETGRYYWNSGIFVWKAGTILAALEEHQPQMFAHLCAIRDAQGSDEFAQVFDREFKAIEGVSIDYAVMEHAADIAVIEAPFSWDDVGNWRSLARLRGADEQGNTITGKHLGENTTGSIIHTSGEHLVVTLGLKDCIVVHTPDATLVANKHDEESIRELVKQIEEHGWQEYL